MERAQKINTADEANVIRLEQVGTAEDEKGKEIYRYPKNRIQAEKEKAKRAK